MSQHFDRRRFLELAAATGMATATGALASAAPATVLARSANESINVAVMGVNNRGTALAQAFASLEGANVAYICDVDERAIATAKKAIDELQAEEPVGIVDFRQALDDESVDVLVVAAPNHWHAPATILACDAGKHVYCEKPCSHNAQEGEWMIEAARKHDRVVQIGTQRRTWSAIREGIKKVHSGAIGEVKLAKSWYNNRRPAVNLNKSAQVPAWLDYPLWQGPAPEVPYAEGLIHYNWHWFWQWGNGELGNNGIHALDLCRWGLNVDYPESVTSLGHKLRHNDDQETPDSHFVSFDFGDSVVSWEGLSWSPHGNDKSRFGVSFHGTEGTIVIGSNGGYKVFDTQDNKVEAVEGESDNQVHVANFCDSIRKGKRPNADIEEGHKSTLLCHLGNISHRVGRKLNTDPTNGHILGDAEANTYWQREYREGWRPKV